MVTSGGEREESLTYPQKKIKQFDQIMCSSDQLRKLVAKVRPVGRMSLEPWITFDQERMQLVSL